MATIQHQLADRKRAIKEKEVLKITAKALASEKEVLQQRLRDLETRVHTHSNSLKKCYKYLESIYS